MFLFFSAVLYHDLKKSSGKTNALRSPLALALGISLTLALTTEMLQFLLASLNRNANLIDLIFDTLGSVAGILLAKLIMQRYGSDS
jgi:glycopeptide antibiotics resistance protein